MPDGLQSLDIGFPDMTEDTGTTEEKLETVLSYLYSLLESLKYVLSNLGTSNFNEVELNNITSPIIAKIEDAEGNIAALKITAEGLTSTVSDLSGDVTEVKQTAAGLSSSVSNLGGEVSEVKQTINGLQITTSGGTTYITGNHVKSGTIEGVTLVSEEIVDGLSTGYSVNIENGEIRLDGAGSATSFIKEDVNGLTIYNTFGGMISINNSIGTVQLLAAIVKLIAEGNLSIDAGSGYTVFIGASNTNETVNIGSATGKVNLSGTITNNGVPLGAAVFT